jgi:hypothetical protein
VVLGGGNLRSRKGPQTSSVAGFDNVSEEHVATFAVCSLQLQAVSCKPEVARGAGRKAVCAVCLYCLSYKYCYSMVCIMGEIDSVVVKALRYKPEGPRLETDEANDFIHLRNPSSCNKPWGVLKSL